MKRQLLLTLVVICLVGFQGRAIAHGVKIEHKTTQAIEIKASYDSGEPMINARVTVYAPDDPAKAWLTGSTDKKGNFIFIPDASKSGYWEVKVRQAGHGAIATIPVESFGLDTANIPLDTKNNDDKVEKNRTVKISTYLTSTSSELRPMQKLLAIASVVWGLVGTSLFFWRLKGREPKPKTSNEF